MPPDQFVIGDIVPVLFYSEGMAFRRDYSLGDAARDQKLLIVRCRDCKREANYFAPEIFAVFGPHKDIHAMKWKCRDCGSYDCEVAARPLSSKPTIVWTPRRVQEPPKH